MFDLRRITAIVLQLALVASFTFTAAQARTNGRDLINAGELKDWLTYLASDEFEGRNTYTEGLGLAAGHIGGQLKSLGVKPGGPNGSYFQRVAVLGVKSANNSSLTVEANGQTRTFKNKEGVSFPANVGNKRSFTADEIEFVGYGLNLPDHNDYAGKKVKGKVVVYLGATPPKGADPRQTFRAMFGRSRNATVQEGAIASIGPVVVRRALGGAAAGSGDAGAGRGAAANEPPSSITIPEPDFTTVQRLDARSAA